MCGSPKPVCHVLHKVPVMLLIRKHGAFDCGTQVLVKDTSPIGFRVFLASPASLSLPASRGSNRRLLTSVTIHETCCEWIR
ncbi:hypothetical protein MPTK1_2g12740 [Marchantia polymorpha subsp. ruderalis]|nr:hypothetical protein Mp_2g12740 [Marchantia polymorpha subsp. ruderalis]